MSLLNNAIGNVGSNPSNMPQKKRPSNISNTSYTFQATAGTSSSSTNSVSSGLSYSATGQILVDKGQIIRGEITDIRNNMVSIKIDLGETITYPLQGDPELTIGQMATFKAVETEDGIALRALSAKPSQARLATINKALEEAGLQKSERNQAIVLELLNNKMSIDKQTIQKIFQQSLMNKDVSISTLVIMNKHNIPITSENATQFENYRNYEHRLNKEIATLAEEIPKMLDKVSTFATPSNFNAINNKVMDLILLPNETYKEVPLHSIMNSNTDINTLLDILRPFGLSDSMEHSILNRTASVQDVANCIQDCIMVAEQMQEELSQSPIAQEDGTKASLAEDDVQSPTQLANTTLTDLFQTPLIRKILDYQTTLQFNNNELSTFLSQQNRQTLLLALDSYHLPDEMKEGIRKGSISSNTLLKAIKDASLNANSADTKSLYSSQVFQWVIKEHIKSVFSLTPEDIAQNKVNEYYENTYSKITALGQMLQDTGLKEVFQDLNSNTQNLKENMDFMKMLNSIFSYVQLPIKMNEQFIHSDLYVYTKKKNLRENPDNISVLLHLDMEHLGPTDIHITLTKGNVLAKFYTSDDYSNNLLKNNIDLLDEALARKGYLLQTSFLKWEKNVDIVKDIIEKDQPTTSLKRYSFDIRA